MTGREPQLVTRGRHELAGRPEVTFHERPLPQGPERQSPGAAAGSTDRCRASAFDIIINKTLTMTSTGGVQREVTVEEALQHRTYQDAIAGNRPACREILKMIAAREGYLSARRRPQASKIEMRVEPNDPENAEAAMLLLGIAVGHLEQEVPKDVGPAIRLEPWAVQAALARRRGGRELTDREMSEIKRCTRASESLRWPRGRW